MRLKSKLICGNCLEIIPTLPRVKMIFADPPDNLNVKYNGYVDRKTNDEYLLWLHDVITAGVNNSSVFWFSYNNKYQQPVYIVLLQ